MNYTYEERTAAKSCIHWESCFRMFRLTHGEKSYYRIDEVLDSMMCLKNCEFYEVSETCSNSCKGCAHLNPCYDFETVCEVCTRHWPDLYEEAE